MSEHLYQLLFGDSTMSSFTGLWVDDARPIPESLITQGWTRARSFHEAIVKLELLEFQEISLDHDLGSFYGNKEMTGQDIVWWLVMRKNEGLYIPSKINVHSANPAGARVMLSIIQQHL